MMRWQRTPCTGGRHRGAMRTDGTGLEQDRTRRGSWETLMDRRWRGEESPLYRRYVWS